MQAKQTSTPADTTYYLSRDSVASTTTGYSATVTLQIAQTDLNALESVAIATTHNSTYLSMDSSCVTDSFANPVEPISSTDALRAREWRSSAAAPTLESFDLDMNQAMLSLTFSDYVNASTFVASGIVLMSETQKRYGNYSSVEGASVSQGQLTESNVVYLAMTDDLLNTLKYNYIGRVTTGTYLTMGEGTVLDAYGAKVQAVLDESEVDGEPLRVNVLTPDTTPPTLRFTLDRLAQPLRCYIFFSEPIALDTRNPSTMKLTLAGSTVHYLLMDSLQLTDRDTTASLAVNTSLTCTTFDGECAAWASNLSLSVVANSTHDFAATPNFLLPVEALLESHPGLLYKCLQH
jgi:hypothetical protein